MWKIGLPRLLLAATQLAKDIWIASLVVAMHRGQLQSQSQLMAWHIFGSLDLAFWPGSCFGLRLSVCCFLFLEGLPAILKRCMYSYAQLLMSAQYVGRYDRDELGEMIRTHNIGIEIRVSMDHAALVNKQH
jgi:hypothetical protein